MLTILDSFQHPFQLYEQEYRAIVVHSSAHDKRRTKRIEREIKASAKKLLQIIAKEEKQEFYCRADAEVAANRLCESETALHNIIAFVEEKKYYGRGRPPKNGRRKVSHTRYTVTAHIEEKADHIAQKRAEAGCFVLLTNVLTQGEMAETGEELLQAYKEQNGIERNFSFLKDPLIVNDLFLKKPERIEVLGAVLLMALMIWNLIEHSLRSYISENETTLPGWDKKKTRRPTAFMMSTKFMGLTVIRVAGICKFTSPLTDTQNRYLTALRLSEDDLLGKTSGKINMSR